MMGPSLNSGRRDLSKRAKISCVLLAILITFFLYFRGPSLLPHRSTKHATQQSESHLVPVNQNLASGYMPICGTQIHSEGRKYWQGAEARYSSLLEDKFTVVMPTYRRPETLETTLSVLLASEIPSLYEIVIIWNDINTEPPQDFVSHFGIPVTYHVPERNSLNNRFIPLPSYKTQAILSTDDDIWYEPDDLEFTFQIWRQLGRHRITGALPRCHGKEHNPADEKNSWGPLLYYRCAATYWHSIITTGLAFLHISFLDFYSSENEMATRIREYVDRIFNCEDIGMNYLVSMLTCTGPLHVVGEQPFYINKMVDGLSKKEDYWDERGECVDYFASEEVVGFCPLVRTYGSIQRALHTEY